MSRFRLSGEARADLKEIWQFIAKGDEDAADRVDQGESVGI